MNAPYLFATFMSRKKYRVKKKKICQLQHNYYLPVFFYPNCVRFDSSVDTLVGLRGMQFIVTIIKQRESYESHIWIEDSQKAGVAALEERIEEMANPWGFLESEKYFAKEKLEDLMLSIEGLDCIILYIKQDVWGFKTKTEKDENSGEYKSKAQPKDSRPDRIWKNPAALHKYLVHLRNRFIDKKIPEKSCLRFNGLTSPSIQTGVCFSQVVGNHFVEHGDRWIRWRPKNSSGGFTKKSLESFSSAFTLHTNNKLFYTCSSYCASEGSSKRLFWVNFDDGKAYQIADKLKGSISVVEYNCRLTIVADELEISKVYLFDYQALVNVSRGHRIEPETLVDNIAPLFPDINLESFDLQTSFIRAVCTGELLFTFFCSSHFGDLVFKARLPCSYLSYKFPTPERLEFAKVGAVRQSLVLATMMTRAQLLVIVVDCKQIRKASVFSAHDVHYNQVLIDRRKIYLVERAEQFKYSITRFTLYF